MKFAMDFIPLKDTWSSYFVIPYSWQHQHDWYWNLCGDKMICYNDAVICQWLYEILILPSVTVWTIWYHPYMMWCKQRLWNLYIFCNVHLSSPACMCVPVHNGDSRVWIVCRPNTVPYSIMPSCLHLRPRQHISPDRWHVSASSHGVAGCRHAAPLSPSVKCRFRLIRRVL
jgi:hypothetical protein